MSELDAFVVMPNHIHGIVLLEGEAAPSHPGKVNGPRRGSLGSFVGSFKAAVTRRTSLPHTVWQRNYSKHIIRSEPSLNAVREYIANNPANWMFDRQNPQGMKSSKPPALWHV